MSHISGFSFPIGDFRLPTDDFRLVELCSTNYNLTNPFRPALSAEGHFVSSNRVYVPVLIGMLCGAVTNTPSRLSSFRVRVSPLISVASPMR